MKFGTNAARRRSPALASGISVRRREMTEPRRTAFRRCARALLPAILCVAFSAASGWPAQAAEAGRAKNPIIWADVPDMSMLRVGDSYYMSSTTMHMNPGIPIMKSADLVSWKTIGYVYDIQAQNDQMTLSNGKNAYGKGSWASSLRYHDGLFYVSTFSQTSGRTHIYRTKDIEKGPWAETSFEPALHDSSLFFDDDGRVYMVYGGGNLRLIELKADASGIKPGGVDQLIIPDPSAMAGPNIGLRAEGSQIFKVNGKYYIFSITSPKGGPRTELVFRSDTLTGPYEGRVALRDRGIAQGGIIDTPDGKWYAYMFEDHGAVGRIPYLMPVQWQDGWPVLGEDGKVPDSVDIPASDAGVSGIVASDEFDRRTAVVKAAKGENDAERSAFPLAWQWNHNPDNRYWSLRQRPGFLRLTAGRVDTDLPGARNTLTQRTFGPECSATVAIDVRHMKDGDYAGLASFQKHYGFVGVKKSGSAKSIVAVNAQTDVAEELESIPLERKTVYLKVDIDYRERADKSYFYYSLDGKQWKAIGKPLQMAYTLPHFMGYRFALFNYATKTAGGYVDFDYFRLSDRISVH